MILCVDSDKLTMSHVVQKDVSLPDILNKHTKYYDTVEDAEKDFYVPMDFSVSVRTVHTNKVVQFLDKGKPQYYVNQTRVGLFVHKGADLIMYLSAIGLMTLIDYRKSFDVFMAKHSVYQMIGLYNPDPGFINPIIYSHIIIGDEAEDELQTYFKPGVSLIPITDMTREGSLSALLDTLILVKGGNNE